MEADIAAAVEALRVALARDGPGDRPVFAVLQLVYADGRSESHSLNGCSMPEKVRAPQGTRVPTDTERTILDVLTRAEKPVKARTIAGRGGIGYTSHLRRTLAEMVRDGRLVHVHGQGYWLASREVPGSHTET